MTNSVSLALLCRLGYCTICKRYRTLRPELYHPSSGAHMEVHETDVALLIHPPAIFLRESSTPPTRPSYTLMSQFCAAPSPSPKSQTFTGFRTMRRLSARQRMCGCGHGRRYRRATMKHPPYTYSSFIKGRRFVLLRVREILNTDAGKAGSYAQQNELDSASSKWYTSI